MLTEAADFRDESDTLHALIAGRSDLDWDRPTQFKGWTLNNVLRHLHFWNIAADLSLHDETAFEGLVQAFRAGVGRTPMKDMEAVYLEGLAGPALLDTWRTQYHEMSERFAEADGKQRLKWVGPTMSARSSITARLMETWAHGQEIYDQLGVVRENTDRIRSICVLGINTFAWTFTNRKLGVPPAVPNVSLTAPSGAIWEFNESNDDDFIEGSAEDFCMVVTQVRSLEDVNLTVLGDTATRWMAIAQCFAGPPVDPPAKGTRFTAKQS
ncbi:MAG TPA: TIGR03084 family metal-binding protein [Pseudomonadales bacterium]|nr:TIGR03084 family metal-binding protein [Pseudomonadales bacterium]